VVGRGGDRLLRAAWATNRDLSSPTWATRAYDPVVPVPASRPVGTPPDHPQHGPGACAMPGGTGPPRRPSPGNLGPVTWRPPSWGPWIPYLATPVVRDRATAPNGPRFAPSVTHSAIGAVGEWSPGRAPCLVLRPLVDEGNGRSRPMRETRSLPPRVLVEAGNATSADAPDRNAPDTNARGPATKRPAGAVWSSIHEGSKALAFLWGARLGPWASSRCRGWRRACSGASWRVAPGPMPAKRARGVAP
jgi:hypothetical protein